MMANSLMKKIVAAVIIIIVTDQVQSWVKSDKK